jgi:hypothetical protein
LEKDAFERFYEGIGESKSGKKRQDKLKIVKYPDMDELGADGETAQGGGCDPCEGCNCMVGANVLWSIVGPHKGTNSARPGEGLPWLFLAAARSDYNNPFPCVDSPPVWS